MKIDASNGSVVTHWGASGNANGQFDEPQGIAVGSNGLIYVSDRANSRVQYFDSNGNFMGVWGIPGTGIGEFDDIIGIAATP